MTRIKNTVSFAATGTSVTQLVQENGFCHTLVIDVPNFTNAVTTSVTILDVDGYVLWTKTGMAKNTIFRVDDTTSPELGSIPFDYGYQVKVDLSGDAGGAGGDVKVIGFLKSMGKGE